MFIVENAHCVQRQISNHFSASIGDSDSIKPDEQSEQRWREEKRLKMSPLCVFESQCFPRRWRHTKTKARPITVTRMASSSSNNDKDLPSSVVGAPEELKAAIRKKQNKEVRYDKPVFFCKLSMFRRMKLWTNPWCFELHCAVCPTQPPASKRKSFQPREISGRAHKKNPKYRG